MWARLWGNRTRIPSGGIRRSTADVILDDPVTEQLVVSIMEEARRIGEQIGIELNMTAQARTAQTRKLGAFKTSMLQAVAAGRQMDIEAILGATHELAANAALPVPFLSMLHG